MHAVSKIIHASMMMRFLFYAIVDLATAFVAGVLLAYLPQFNPFLIFIPTIAFFAWIGGFMTGFTTTVVSFFFITIMLFFPTKHPLLPANNNLIFETAIFFFVAIFISYIIDTAKQQDKITDYQKKLRQTHQVIETLEKSYENSQTEIKARDQFLAIASHELKTPVTSMLLQVQTAIHNIRNVSLANFSVATLLKMLEDTEQQSKRLSKMVNDLLDLSLITTGKMDLEIEKVDISRTTQDVAERFANRLVDKNQLRIITKKTVIGYCDKLRIEQAITNLISNAIKY
jgi:signal transduction histidine kinase